MDAAAVLIPPRLCHCYIFKMNRKNPGRKKLPVRDLTALFEDQLFHFFMIHSCQRVTLLSRIVIPPCDNGREQKQVPESWCAVLPDPPHPLLLCSGWYTELIHKDLL